MKIVIVSGGKAPSEDILLKEVKNAANGAEGCEKFVSVSPDLVLLDISMPVMNGLEALKKMVEINPCIPIIMCSAIGQESQMLEAIQSGAREFIVKPFTDDQIFKTVQSFLND